ncbi:unnamed protein product [Tuber melanosporum]|uniref:(Perigord truffle) hypothetical protein n=1 Tax=Tuber melanosporum (strain Mel28) TaxID=656061 RepID=D5G5D2_TUBMM|nr:uncharacterized protein GSTUM_00004276001 [Tuber melanosporum]CAZ79725.1 unnamed protein product [Tuber melanosporum]
MFGEGYSAEDKGSLKLGRDVEARHASLNHGTAIDSRRAEVDLPEAIKFGKATWGLSSRQLQLKAIGDSTGTGLFWLLTRGDQNAPAEAGPWLVFLAYYFALLPSIGGGSRIRSISLLRRWANGALSPDAGLRISVGLRRLSVLTSLLGLI